MPHDRRRLRRCSPIVCATSGGLRRCSPSSVRCRARTSPLFAIRLFDVGRTSPLFAITRACRGTTTRGARDTSPGSRREYHDRSRSRASPRVRRDDDARRRTTHRPVRAASITIDRGQRVTARAARVGSAYRRRDRHRLPETVFLLRLAPFLGPDPRFRSNRFLGSRIGACS